MSDHEHCWHNDSGMDSAIYRSDGSGESVTHLMCCYCGLSKQDVRKWKSIGVPSDGKKHGSHSWQKARQMFEANFT